MKETVARPFIAEFRFRAGGGSGADGMVFMFYKNREEYAITDGECLGFGPLPACYSAGYGVEFDNHQNWFDPSGRHIALIKDTTRNHLIYVDDQRVEDNQWHDVLVDVKQDSVFVFVDDEVVFSWNEEFDTSYSNLGFAAAIAGLSNWHIVDDVSITGIATPIDWMVIDPISGTIPVGTSTEVTITLDATDLEPDVYDTNLYIATNDPLSPSAQVPVTLTVEPTSSMGWLEGIVYDIRTGEALEATLTAYGQPNTITSDPHTGYYKFWLEGGTHTIEVWTPGYVTQTAEVEVIAQHGTTHDFDLLLDAPWLQLSPASVEVSQPMGGLMTRTLTITNAGTADLTFDIVDGVPQSGSALLLHLDEPEGATTFFDSSGNENHGYCSGDRFPTAGVTGRYGRSVYFDGAGDFIATPLINDPDYSWTLAAWVFPELLNNYGSSPDGVGLGHTIIDGDYSAYGGNGIGIDADEIRILYGDLWLVDQNFPYDFEVNTWYHIAAVFEVAHKRLSVYVNGQVIGEEHNVPFVGGGPTDPYHIGYKPYVWNIPFKGIIDEVMVFDRALTGQEVLALSGDPGGIGGADWLSAEPASGTISSNGSQVVRLAFDTLSLVPDTYTTIMAILNNDPLALVTNVPVTMTVEPTSSMGWLEGVVYDIVTGEVIEATLTIYGHPYTYTSAPQTGYYKFWLEQGTYTIGVSATGYISETAEVEITAQQGTTRNFALLLDETWPPTTSVFIGGFTGKSDSTVVWRVSLLFLLMVSCGLIIVRRKLTPSNG